MLGAPEVCASNNDIKQRQITHGPSELGLILISLLLGIIFRSAGFSMKSFPRSVNSLSGLMSDGISSPYQNTCRSLPLLPMDLNYRAIKSIIPTILTSHISKSGVAPTQGFLMVSATEFVGLAILTRGQRIVSISYTLTRLSLIQIIILLNPLKIKALALCEFTDCKVWLHQNPVLSTHPWRTDALEALKDKDALNCVKNSLY